MFDSHSRNDFSHKLPNGNEVLCTRTNQHSVLTPGYRTDQAKESRTHNTGKHTSEAILSFTHIILPLTPVKENFSPFTFHNGVVSLWSLST